VRRHARQLLDLRADEAPTVVLDVETTGLRAEAGDRIVEIAIIEVDLALGQMGAWESLIFPERPMPAETQAIHGISDEDVLHAPRFAELHAELCRRLDDVVVVGHNIRFDIGFLRMESERLGLRPPDPAATVCTLELARDVFGLPRCSLPVLAQRCNVAMPFAHRARVDAAATFGVYRSMLQSMAGDHMPTIGELAEQVTSLRRDGPGRKAIVAALSAARSDDRPVVIDYTSRDGQGELLTRRAITVREVRLPYVEAWCHLRQEDRVFHVGRIQRIREG
jgi:DNA polymerase-3 subunit epsilon